MSLNYSAHLIFLLSFQVSTSKPHHLQLIGNYDGNIPDQKFGEHGSMINNNYDLHHQQHRYRRDAPAAGDSKEYDALFGPDPLTVRLEDNAKIEKENQEEEKKTKDEEEASSSTMWIIIGCVSGGVVASIVIGIFVYCFIIKKKKNKNGKKDEAKDKNANIKDDNSKNNKGKTNDDQKQSKSNLNDANKSAGSNLPQPSQSQVAPSSAVPLSAAG